MNELQTLKTDLNKTRIVSKKQGDHIGENEVLVRIEAYYRRD